MKKIVSKNIVALWPGGGLLADEYFRSIREKLNISDRYDQKEESGDPKKNTIPATGLGSNDRGHNSGAGMGLGRDENESKQDGLSSGYNDGEAAQDETGPGNTNQPVNPYYATDVLNELFLDLKLKNPEKNRSNLKKILNGPSMPLPHRRVQV